MMIENKMGRKKMETLLCLLGKVAAKNQPNGTNSAIFNRIPLGERPHEITSAYDQKMFNRMKLAKLGTRKKMVTMQI